MNVSRAERILLVVAALATLYRIAREEWPVALEVTPTEADE